MIEYCAFFNSTKHKEYDFLSNFYPSSVKSKYGTFKCAEGLYQYHKFMHLPTNLEIKEAFIDELGQQAWDISRKLETLYGCSPSFNKLDAMMETLKCKFNDETLKNKLIDTGTAYLVENCPKGHDSFWADDSDGTGKNMLGILLMKLRKTLIDDEEYLGVVSVPKILETFYSKKCVICGNSCFFTNSKIVYNYCEKHIGGEIKLGNVSTRVQLSNIPDGTGRFLYFNLNDMPEFVEEGARLISQRIKELNLPNPFFVTPETSTISLAHVLRTKYSIPGIIVSKHKKPNDIDVVSEEYCSITSMEKKILYLDKSNSVLFKNTDIVIIDNVCTTGETIRAVYRLLCKCGADYKKIIETIVLFTEGTDSTVHNVKITNEINLPLHKFEHIPILPLDPSIDNTLYHLYSTCELPTQYGTMKFCVFKHRSLEKEAVACVSPLTSSRTNIPIRIHDACITSEVFHSIKCDCKLQLDKSFQYISEYGGIIIYLNQEGRGIGLGNKILAYNLQETLKLDTVDANRKLGLLDDTREYTAAKDILNYFQIESIMLMTNNPRKIECLKKLNVVISGTIPCIITPESCQMEKYMKNKVEKMHHTIPIEKLDKYVL